MSSPQPPQGRQARPRNLAVTPHELAIAWSDGHESYYPFGELRRSCPCATCRERPRQPAGHSLSMLSGPSIDELRITELRPVGAYAVQIVWSDGHDTGIYSFETLRASCPCAECS